MRVNNGGLSAQIRLCPAFMALLFTLLTLLSAVGGGLPAPSFPGVEQPEHHRPAALFTSLPGPVKSGSGGLGKRGRPRLAGLLPWMQMAFAQDSGRAPDNSAAGPENLSFINDTVWSIGLSCKKTKNKVFGNIL